MAKALHQLEAKLGGVLLDSLSAEASTSTIRIQFYDSDDPTTQRTPDSNTKKFAIDPENTQGKGKVTEYILCDSHSTTDGITTLSTVTRGLQRDETVDLSGSATRAQAWDSGTPVGVATEPHNINLMKAYFEGTEPVPDGMEFDGANQFDGVNTHNAGVIVQGSSSYIKFPTMTTAQRTALSASNGMVVYDTDDNLFYQYKAGAWASIDTGTTTPNAADNTGGVVDIASATEIGAGTATDAVSGAINVIPVSQTTKTSNGSSDENKLPVLNSDGQLDKGFIPDSNESLEAGENVTAGGPLRLKIDGKVYKTVDDPEIGALFEALNTPGAQLFASTSIDTDKLAFVYSDGTNVSVIAATIDGDHLTFGSEVDVDACTGGMVDITKLDTDKFGIVYRDTGDTNKGKLAICTVSGTTITDGTPDQFEAGSQGSNADMQVISPDTDLGVIVWCDDATNDELRAMAFTVSGTTPTLGSEVDVTTAANSGDNFSAAVLTTTTFVVSFKTASNSLSARAGSIAGTAITMGTTESLHAGITLTGPAVNNMACAQVDTDKFAVAYYDSGADKEYLIVGTTSGTTITDGTPVEISSGCGGSSPLYLEKFAANKLILWYHPGEANNTPSGDLMNPRGTVAWVTTSGTVPTVHDIYNLANLNVWFTNGAGYQRCHYQLTPFSSDCIAVLMQTATDFVVHGVVIADNKYVGFADATTNSGSDVQVNYTEDDNQSSLSLGSKYWLDSSGGISLQGRAYAGVAVSTTKIARI